MNFDVRQWRHLDKILILVMLALIACGVVAISSAARGGFGPDQAHLYVDKQIVSGVIGLCLFLIALLFDYSEFQRMTWVIYGLNAALLALTLALGVATNGAVEWIGYGSVKIQPSEFGKVMLILTLGHVLSKVDRMDRLTDLVMPAAHVLPLLALILLQNDLGTALVFVAIAIGMVYMAGFPGWKLSLMIGAPIAAIGAWVYFYLLPWAGKILAAGGKIDHRLERLVTFVNPGFDPQDAGWQVLQSRVAIGSGGLLGQELYHGTQNQLGFLPEQHTDFIFSVVGEELGFVGGAVLIVLFLILLWRIMVIANTAKDSYGTLIATGVAGLIGFHVLESIGMTMGVMPMTGIPLPFISYGGSALMADMLAVGLVLNVGMRRQKIMF